MLVHGYAVLKEVNKITVKWHSNTFRILYIALLLLAEAILAIKVHANVFIMFIMLLIITWFWI